MYARVALYKLKPGKAQEVYQRAAAGLLPIFRQQEGFHSYEIISTGPDSFMSSSLWLTEANARDAAEAAGQWVTANLSEFIVSLDTHVGPVVFSHV